jgi:hypothetical protein
MVGVTSVAGLGTSDLPETALRCPSNRLMQGAKRSPYVDMGKLCNAAAGDSKGNPSNACLHIEWDESGPSMASLPLT